MKRYVCAALAALVVVSFTVPAFAQAPAMGAKFATHIQTHATKISFICGVESPNDTTTSAALACQDYVTSFPLMTEGDLYVVIAQADSEGVSGCSFGLDYTDPRMMLGWIPCISGIVFESDTWPDPGSGARLTWIQPADCQNQVIPPDEVHAVAGAFYVYAYTDDKFVITPNRTLLSGPELAITNCAGAETLFDTENVERAGFVSFGGTDPGCNPCVLPCDTPVEATTWGEIKNKYVDN